MLEKFINRQKVKVTILKSIAGLAEPRFNQPAFSYSRANVVEVHLVLAKAWIASGVAQLGAVELEPIDYSGWHSSDVFALFGGRCCNCASRATVARMIGNTPIATCGGCASLY